jgi:hypothetical protein
MLQKQKATIRYGGQWLVQFHLPEKPLSANADNDDNANADKNIRRGDLAAGKCRTKIAVCVTHQLWLSSQFKD